MTLASAYDARFFSEELFARMFHASPVALSLSTLADGRYLEVNDSFLRAIVLANWASATLGFLAALLQQLSGGVNALGWSSVVIYLSLAPGFAYFQFMKPSVMRPSGA